MTGLICVSIICAIIVVGLYAALIKASDWDDANEEEDEQ